METKDRKLEWQCCFCAQTIEAQEANQIEIAIIPNDGTTQCLRAHTACLRQHLHESVPLPVPEDDKQ